MTMLLAAVAVAASSYQVPQAEPRPFMGREVFHRLITKAKTADWKALPIGEVMAKVGMELVGTPYVGFTAERWVDREVCSVDLTGLDCVTFFENSLAFSRMLKKGGTRPREMRREVELTRYRDGKLSDYTSRLHYTSDWIFDNGKKGTVKVLGQQLPGAERFTHPVGYMTQNPDKYKQLAKFATFVPVIADQEKAINSRETYFVPTSKVADVEPLLQTGDIIGITTNATGLDCSHTGFVIRDKHGILRFIHASSAKKQVLLDVRLSDYLKGSATGIMVARPLEP